MNVKKFLSALVLCLAIFSAGVGAGVYLTRMAQHISGTTQTESRSLNVRQAQAQSETPPQTNKMLYLVKSDGGKVGIFQLDEGGTPVLQYYSDQINLNALREQDKAKLAEGITVNGNEELASLIEDFSS